MNQLETNLVLWAIISIILFELLFIICLCRCCASRIKPKRFYVKREEYEYLQSNNGTLSQLQSTILRPPHADELALVGTIREQNPTINFDGGIENLGFYREDDDNELNPPAASVLAAAPTSSPRTNWIELRPSMTNGVINTAQLSPADYDIRSYPTDDYIYPHQSSPPHPNIIDLHQYRTQYKDNDQFKDNDDELENFQFHSLYRSEVPLSYIQRTDTSTESFNGNTLTLLPKSILKSSASITPPIDLISTQYLPVSRSRTSSKYDQSPRISVKINTDESVPIDYPTSAIERMISTDSITSPNILTPSLISSDRMRFASVSQLNEIEWEVPSEFHTVVYDSIEDRQRSLIPVVYSSNRNLNNSNNDSSSTTYNEKLSNRQRSQSASVDQRKYVSRIYVPWDSEKKILQPLYLLNDIERVDITQQKAFEY